MSDKGPGLSRALPKYEGGCYEGIASHPTATFPPGKCPHHPSGFHPPPAALKQELAFDDWMYHPDANNKLVVLEQDTRKREGWDRYSHNQPGLYYQPATKIFYRVQIQNGRHLVHKIALGLVLDWIDSLP